VVEAESDEVGWRDSTGRLLLAAKEWKHKISTPRSEVDLPRNGKPGVGVV